MSKLIKSYLIISSFLLVSSIAFGDEAEVIKVDPVPSIQEEVDMVKVNPASATQEGTEILVVVPKKKSVKRVRKNKPLKAGRSYHRKNKPAEVKVINTNIVEEDITDQTKDSN